jgi:predicted transposase YdaD
MSEAELRQHGTAALMELLLKQARYRTFLKWIKSHAEEIKILLDSYYDIGGIHYILGVEDKYSSEEIIEAILEIAPDKQEDIMTAARQLEIKGEKRGRQQGMQQGMQTKALDIAKNMLSKLHLDVETVAQATGLSQEELMKLQADTNQ